MFQQLISIVQKAAKAASKTTRTARLASQASQDTSKAGQAPKKLLSLGVQVAIQSGLNSIFTALSAATSPLGAVLIMAGGGFLIASVLLLAILIPIMIVVLMAGNSIVHIDSPTATEDQATSLSRQGAVELVSHPVDTYATLDHPAYKSDRIKLGSAAAWCLTASPCNNHKRKLSVGGIDMRVADLLWWMHTEGWTVSGSGFGVRGHTQCVKNTSVDDDYDPPKKSKFYNPSGVLYGADSVGCSESHHIYGRGFDLNKMAKEPLGTLHGTCGIEEGGKTVKTVACKCTTRKTFTKDKETGTVTANPLPSQCRKEETYHLGGTEDIDGDRQPPGQAYTLVRSLLSHPVLKKDEGRLQLTIGMPISLYNALYYYADGEFKNYCRESGVGCFNNSGHNGHLHIDFCGVKDKYTYTLTDREPEGEQLIRIDTCTNTIT